MNNVFRSVVGTVALGAVISGLVSVAAAEVKFKRSAFAAGNREVSDAISGYITDEGTVKSASATFKVPTLSCGDDTRAVFLGIQGGSGLSAADVILVCDGGAPLYILEAFAGDENPQAEVQPGDTVKVSLTAKNGTITAKANNLTAKVEADPEAVVLFGTLAATETPPPDFGKATVKKSKLNGKTLSAKKATKVNLANDGATITTGKLKKGKFTLTFKD